MDRRRRHSHRTNKPTKNNGRFFINIPNKQHNLSKDFSLFSSECYLKKEPVSDDNIEEL